MVYRHPLILKIIQFLFYISTSIGLAQYQSFRDIMDSKENTDIHKIEKINSLLAQNIRDNQRTDVGLIAHRFSNWHYQNKRVAKAIATLHISITYHNPDNADTDLQNKLYKLGFFYYKIKDYKKSNEAYKRSLKVKGSNDLAGQVYYKIAANYYKLGDYDLSRIYYELSEQVFLKLKNYKRLLKCYSFSYNTYSKLESKEALEKLEYNLLQADSLATILSISNTDRYNIKKALSSYYNDYKTRDSKKGIPFAYEALHLAKKMKDSSLVSSSYIKLGILNDHKYPDIALDFHKKALAYCPSSNKKLLSIIYANLGLNNAHLGNNSLSITQQLRSLVAYTGTDFKNISSEEISKILNERYEDGNLRTKLANTAESYLLFAEKTKNKEMLQEAIRYFKLADKTIDIYHKNSSANTSKLIWRKKATEIYGRALKACYLANDPTAAFEFMEKNKSLLLYEEQKKQRELQNLQLPEPLVKREQYLTNKLNELERIKNNDKVALKLQIRYNDSLVALTDSIKRMYKDYKSLLESFTPFPYSDLKSSLTPNEAIIQYHIPIDNGYGIYPNATNGYGLIITAAKTHFFEMDSLQLFKSKIEELQKKNIKPFTTKEDIVAYRTIAHTVYNKLFPTEEIRHTIEGKQLTIIPDDYLTTIPFESLIVSLNTSNDYLIKHAQIHYKYSYTFHEEMRVSRSSNTSHFSGFAPVKFDPMDLSSLEDSQEEIESINSYYKGNTYSGVKANKRAFKEALKRSNIIHLATHADATDSIIPWIAFSDKKLYLNELYLIKNNADLVFLSACNTSTGKIETGEGVMSLSRGFFYGGANSTISSLWNVDDKSTQYIVKQSYKNLYAGTSKAVALHRAKLNYLENHTGSEIAPYYWASFVLIGDSSPLPTKNYFLYYSMEIVGMLLIFLFFIRRTKNKK